MVSKYLQLSWTQSQHAGSLVLLTRSVNHNADLPSESEEFGKAVAVRYTWL